MGFITRKLTGRALDEAADRLASQTERAIDEVIRLRSAAIAREVDEHRAEREQPVEDLARELIYRRCRVSAASGAATSLPAVLPGVGTAIGLASALGDAAAQLYAEVSLILALAHAYGLDLADHAARRADVLAVLGIEADVLSLKADGSLKGAAANANGSELAGEVNRGLGGQVIKRVARQRVRTILGRELPFGVGVAIGAGSNFRTVRRVGRTAMKYFATRRSA